MKGDAPGVAFCFYGRCSGLPEILIIRAVTDNGGKTVFLQRMYVGGLNLSSNRTVLREFVDRHLTCSDRVDRNLQITYAIVFGLRQFPGPHVDLDRRQQQLWHAEFAITTLA